MKWNTRSDWGARAPRNVRTDIDPTGVAVHWYGGGSFRRSQHADCLRLVKAAQDQHMADPDLNDIMYSLAACHHGYVIEARSTRGRPRVRPGANGTAAANARWYAVLALWGKGDGTPADSLLHAIRDAIDWLRSEAGAGKALSGHRDHVSTECPGDRLYAWAHDGAPRPKSKQEEDDMPSPRGIVDELLSRKVELTDGERERYPRYPAEISVRSLLLHAGAAGHHVADLVWAAPLTARTGETFTAEEFLAAIREWAYGGHKAREVALECLGTLGEIAARIGAPMSDKDRAALAADIAQRVDRLRVVIDYEEEQP